MSNNSPTNEEVINMIIYIKQKIDDVSIDDRKNILRIIKASVDDNKIHSKGNGTQIKFKDLPIEVVQQIYTYIHEKLIMKMDNLKNFTEENID